MSKNTEIDQAIRDLNERIILQPDWMKRVAEHYRRTGTFPDELRRVLGDPCKGVAITTDKSLESFFGH
jgi:hypothetical protein